MDDLDADRAAGRREEERVWNAPSASDGESAYGSDEAADLAQVGVVSVGDLLGTSARIFGSGFVPFTVIVLLVTLPGLALDIGSQEWVLARTRELVNDPYALEGAVAAQAGLAALALRMAVLLVQTALGFLAHAAIMYGAVELLAGRSATIGKSLAGGFASTGTVLALALLNTLAIGAGTLACIIPGIILTCVLFVSVPAAVVERLGPIEAMQRSSDLTSGHRWTIFLALFVVFLVFFMFACVMGMFAELTQMGRAVEPAYSTLGNRAFGYALDVALGVPLSVFQAVLAAVFYARVRGVRDGVDADAIARVFE